MSYANQDGKQPAQQYAEQDPRRSIHAELTTAQARVAELEKERDALCQAFEATDEAIRAAYPGEAASQTLSHALNVRRLMAERDQLKARAAEMEKGQTRRTEVDALRGALILCSKHIGAALPHDCPTRYYVAVAWQVEEFINALRARAEKAEGDARWVACSERMPPPHIPASPKPYEATT